MDIALILDGGTADIALSGGDLVTDRGLRTAVTLSLFSDARAPDAASLPAGETGLRGYWADGAEDRFGSLLWLLRREKMVPAVARRAEDHARAALQWLVDDGIAGSVAVAAELQRPQLLALDVRLTRGPARRYDYLWRAMEEERRNVAVPATVQPATYGYLLLFDFVNQFYRILD